MAFASGTDCVRQASLRRASGSEGICATRRFSTCNYWRSWLRPCSGLESLLQNQRLLVQSLQLLPQCRVVLAQAFNGGLKFGDSSDKLRRIPAQQIQPLKRGLAKLLAFEGQREPNSTSTTACWPFQETRSPFGSLHFQVKSNSAIPPVCRVCA
jgi:hypothetical protein